MKKEIPALLTSIMLISSLNAYDSSEEYLKQYVCNILPSLDGWCSEEKALSFIDLILKVKPYVCVEIGVFGGASLFPVASALKHLQNGIVIGIDPWNKDETVKYMDPIKEERDIEWWSKLDHKKFYKRCLRMIQANDLEPYVGLLHTTSEKAAQALQNIDILFIDGNKSLNAFLYDLKTYLPKVRFNGYVWLNDVRSGDRLNQANELLSNWTLRKSIDNGNCILLQKTNYEN